MSPPVPGEKVPSVTSRYFNARNRRRSFDFLTRKFKESGITRAELAVRTGKSRALISRLLGQPGNLTADTMAELLFAMSGEEIQYSAVRPPVGDIEVRQASQQTSAEWMSKRNVKNSTVDVYD
jgi:transcriptional regulator with XRE-family HTH domain